MNGNLPDHSPDSNHEINKMKWTQEEISILKKEYKKEIPDLIKLSKLFDRNKSNICRKARELGFKTSYFRPKSETAKEKTRNTKGWSRQKEFWLITNYNIFTNKELAKILDCTESGIEKRLKDRGLKKDYNERGFKWRDGHPKGMEGKKHSEIFKQKMSKWAKEMWANPDHYLNSEEHRQILSDRAVKLQKEKVFRCRYSRAKVGKRKDLGIYVRSSWEANFARYLNWMKIHGDIKKWEYEADTFDFPVKRGTRFYTPDFKVWEKDGKINYYEVKGWMTQKGQTALNRMAKYYPHIQIILIAKKEYNEIAKWKTLFPNWE